MRISFETVGILAREGDKAAANVLKAAAQGILHASDVPVLNAVYVSESDLRVRPNLELWSRRDENELFEFVDAF